MLSTRRPGRDVLGGRLLPPERRGARTSVVVPVLPPDRLYPYPLPFDEGNCHDVCEHRLLVTSYQVPPCGGSGLRFSLSALHLRRSPPRHRSLKRGRCTELGSFCLMEVRSGIRFSTRSGGN